MTDLLSDALIDTMNEDEQDYEDWGEVIKHEEEPTRTWSTGDVTVNPCVMFSHSWVWKSNQQQDYQYTMDRRSLTNQQSQSLLLQDFSSQTRKAVFFFFLLNPCGRDWTQLICLIYNDRNQFNQRDKSTNRGLILLIYNLSWSKTSERQLICFVNE